MTRIIPILLAVCFLSLQAHAQNFYLKYDENCMDRLEYSTGDAGGQFISYSLKTGEKSFLLFDIGREDAKWQKDLPGKISYCNSIPFGRDLVKQINAGTVKFFIVRETPTQYHVAPVDKASFFAQQGNAVQFLMEDTEFLMHTDQLISQVNLALPNAEKEVYLEGIIGMKCLTGYMLQKRDGLQSPAYKAYIFIPELGIIERSSVIGANAMAGTRSAVLKLDKVANRTLTDAVSTMCDRIQANFYDGKPKEDLAVKTAGTPTEYSGGDPCAPSQVSGIHVVQKGETMFGISRRFGISLDQLRVWNKMPTTDMIAVCQKLYVKDPSTVAGTTTAQAPATTTGGTAITVAEKSGAAGYWMAAPEVHTVRPGESVAGLANLFGYTEDRFRKMNGLGPNEIIYIGQRLRTSDCVCPTLASTTKDGPPPYQAETEKIITKDNNDVYFRPVKIHQVTKEDTLFSIAEFYNTTVERILELNGMKSGDKISPDQKIYVQ